MYNKLQICMWFGSYRKFSILTGVTLFHVTLCENVANANDKKFIDKLLFYQVLM